MLPACFVLKLAKKMPMCLELIHLIEAYTELECTDVSAPYPLISMIVQHASDKQLDCKNNKGLTVVSHFFFIVLMNLYNAYIELK